MKKTLCVRILTVGLVLFGQAYLVSLDNNNYVNFISFLSIGLLIGGIVASLNSLTFLKKFAASHNVDKELMVLAGASLVPAIFAILFIAATGDATVPTFANAIPYAMAPVFLASAVLSRPILLEGKSISLSVTSTILPWGGMLTLIILTEKYNQATPFLIYSILLALGNLALILIISRTQKVKFSLHQEGNRNYKQNIFSDLSLVLVQRVPIFLASNYLSTPPGILFSMNLLQSVSANANFIRAGQIKHLTNMNSTARIRPGWITISGIVTATLMLALLALANRFQIEGLILSISVAIVGSPFIFMTASLPTSGQVSLDGKVTIGVHMSSLFIVLTGFAIVYFADFNDAYVVVAYMCSVTLMRTMYAWKLFKKRAGQT
jgi:hypothetical protein